MAELDARETLFLELINRARLDPAAEAIRHALAADAITTESRQILAPNSQLSDAATGHAAWMNSADMFSHTGLNNSTPTQRMQSAGYFLDSGTGWSTAENISWSGSSSQAAYDANAAVLDQHRNLFLSTGHRNTILNGDLREIGVGTDLGVYSRSDGDFYGMMSAFNFARSGSSSFVSGVAYTDANDDHFYSIGEGKSGVTAQLLSGASVLATTANQTGGAYALATTHAGAVEIVFSGGGIQAAGAAFNMGSANVKFDLVDGSTIVTNVSATLTRAAAHLELLGIDDVNATGNASANTMGRRGL